MVTSGVFSQERSHECHPKLICTATTSNKVIIQGAYQVILEHNPATAYFYQSDLSAKTHHRYPFNLQLQSDKCNGPYHWFCMS